MYADKDVVAADRGHQRRRVPAFRFPVPMARALENATLLHLGLVAHSVKHANFALGVNILS
jgi:hypothetical protein